MGVVLGGWDSIDLYIERIEEIFNTSEAREKFANFDALFSSIEIISLEREPPGAEPEGAILLVRSHGDPEENREHARSI
jgi:hypothetical protein